MRSIERASPPVCLPACQPACLPARQPASPQVTSRATRAIHSLSCETFLKCRRDRPNVLRLVELISCSFDAHGSCSSEASCKYESMFRSNLPNRVRLLSFRSIDEFASLPVKQHQDVLRSRSLRQVLMEVRHSLSFRLVHQLTYSFALPLAHSLTHSLTHSLYRTHAKLTHRHSFRTAAATHLDTWLAQWTVDWIDEMRHKHTTASNRLVQCCPICVFLPRRNNEAVQSLNWFVATSDV